MSRGVEKVNLKILLRAEEQQSTITEGKTNDNNSDNIKTDKEDKEIEVLIE